MLENFHFYKRNEIIHGLIFLCKSFYRVIRFNWSLVARKNFLNLLKIFLKRFVRAIIRFIRNGGQTRRRSILPSNKLFRLKRFCFPFRLYRSFHGCNIYYSTFVLLNFAPISFFYFRFYSKIKFFFYRSLFKYI